MLDGVEKEVEAVLEQCEVDSRRGRQIADGHEAKVAITPAREPARVTWPYGTRARKLVASPPSRRRPAQRRLGLLGRWRLPGAHGGEGRSRVWRRRSLGSAHRRRC